MRAAVGMYLFFGVRRNEEKDKPEGFVVFDAK